MDHSESQARRIREILGYLVEHPDAKDTIDGVSSWWIKGVNSESDREEVQHALNWLRSQGWVSVRNTTPQPLYLFNREYMERAKLFIKNQKEGQLGA